MKPKVAIVRGKFLNQYEMQSFAPLTRQFDLTAFGSLTPYHDRFDFPVVKLPSPMDLPNFPYKMPILNRIFADAHYLWSLEGRLKGFDLVHTAETYYHYTQQCLNAKRKGYVKKVIATVLENIPFNNEGIWGRKAFKKRAREELDHIIVLTELTQKALVSEGCDPAKITIIGHGIDTGVFKPRASRKKDSEPLVILFCGRLEIHKGVYEVLEAAKRLISDRSLKTKLQFWLVGDGREKQKLLSLEKQWGLTSFVKHFSFPYSEMPRIYQRADIFVAPSKSEIRFMVRGWIDRTLKSRPDPGVTWVEQYNTALLEAQAAGLPIVTTRSGGIPENVGEAAILVPPADIRALAYALKRFITSRSLRRQFGQKARHRALTVHDVQIIAAKIARVYEKILFGR